MLSTIANLDAFRLDAAEDDENVAERVNQYDVDVENTAGDQRSANSNINNTNNSTATSTASSQQNLTSTNNSVNKKDDLAKESADQEHVALPPPVKPKPPTATKPVPQNLPNYTSERGAGRGRAQQQQVVVNQSQSNTDSVAVASVSQGGQSGGAAAAAGGESEDR